MQANTGGWQTVQRLLVRSARRAELCAGRPGLRGAVAAAVPRVNVYGLATKVPGKYASGRPGSHKGAGVGSGMGSGTGSRTQGRDPEAAESAKPTGPIRDERIGRGSGYVRLVDPKTEALAGPFDLRQILAKLDRSRFWLEQVAPGRPWQATVEYDPNVPVDATLLVQFPVCKLIDKKEQYDRRRALKRGDANPDDTDTGPATLRKDSTASKEVQLSWAVTANDLAHKVAKARKEMLRGTRINVVVAAKQGSPWYFHGRDPAEDQRRVELLRNIEHLLCAPDPEPDAAIPNSSERPLARRLEDIDWQRGRSIAVMRFERVRPK